MLFLFQWNEMISLILRTFILIAFFSAPFDLFAQAPSEYIKFFNAEEYEDAILVLKTADEKKLGLGQRAYYLGLCYARLRKFDQAIEQFKIAIKAGDESADLYYEYGQVLFSNNFLKQARYEFSKSSGKNYKYTASTYYVAHISELLDDLVTAKANYRKLIRDSKTDKKFLQVSLFQYAKILLKMMRQEEERFRDVERNLIGLDINLINYIPKYILPLLKKAQDVDPNSELGAEIAQFTYSLTEEFRLDPNTMANGRRISPYRLYANISQRLKYDDNVAVTNFASAINETSLFAKYDFVGKKKKNIISPELSLSYTKHRDQENVEVYQNDSFSMSSAIRTKFEHSYNNQPATFLFDLEYSMYYKDWNYTHKRELYSKTMGFGLGEQFSVFNTGETYIKFKYSSYQDEPGYSKYKTYNISADQYVFLKEGQHLLITSIDLGKLDFYEYPLYSSDSYVARLVYLIFEPIPTYTLQFVMSATITDPKEQRVDRGYELTTNPSIDISKSLTNKLKLGINYNYIENSSKLEAYKYHKQIVATELSYTF